LDIKEEIHGVKAAPKDDKKEIAMKQKGCLGQVFYQ
jgi:hypothetical protein